jgi:hypothetical protein
VISGISLKGKLYMMEQERSFKSQDIVRFLRHLLRQIEGKLLVVLDGSPIHRGQAVKDFLASGAPRGCNWNNYLVILRTSTPKKGSGST